MRTPFFQNISERLPSRKLIFASILILASIYQIWRLSPQVSQDLIDIRKDIGQSGLWRSANFSQNQRYANYVKYLHENIPPDARVILPPRETGPKAAATTPFMQFFLAPREVLNCIQPITDCINTYSNNHTYFVIVDAASLQNDRADLSRTRLMLFDQSWGVYLPTNPSSDVKSPLPSFQNVNGLFLAISRPALWLGILVIAGLLVTHQLGLSHNWLMSVGVAYGISLGFVTLSAVFLMLVGIPLTPLIIIFITGIWVTLSLFLWFLTDKNSLRPKRKAGIRMLTIRSINPWPLIFMVLTIIAIILSVGKGYHTSDAIVLWGAKGYGIASQGLVLGASDWGTSTTRYPLHIPILIAAFKVLFGENLPASKLIFPLYYFALLGILYVYLQTKIPQPIAGLSTLTLASAPLLFRHAQIAYANLPFTFYFVSAVLISLRAVGDDLGKYRYNRLLLSGIFFGLGAWTRPEGIPISLVTLFLILLLCSPKVKPTYSRTIIFLAAPLVIFSSLWLVFSGPIYMHSEQNTRLLSNALNHLLRGDLHLTEAGFILNYLVLEFLSPSTWGIVGIGSVLFILAGIFNPQTKVLSPSVLTALLFLLIFIGIYYLSSFDSTHDISWWVSTGLNRMIMPGVTLLWVGAVESLFGQYNLPQPPS